MKNKQIIVSLLASSILMGCGGSSSDSSDPNDSSTSTETYTIKAIDGYLENAKVYADRNRNDEADNDELLGSTNALGELVIAEDNKHYQLIVVATAGETIDADTGKAITENYTLKAAEGSKVVTPFTHMAVEDNKTFADIALEINPGLSAEQTADYVAILESDYIESKNSVDSDIKNLAEAIHVLARYMVEEISIAQAGGDAFPGDDLHLDTAFIDVVNLIEDADLNSVSINVSANGVVTREFPAYMQSVFEGEDTQANTTVSNFIVAPDRMVYMLFNYQGSELFAYGTLKDDLTAKLYGAPNTNLQQEHTGTLLLSENDSAVGYSATIRWDNEGAYTAYPDQFTFTLEENSDAETVVANIPARRYSNNNGESIDYASVNFDYASGGPCDYQSAYSDDISNNGILSFDVSKLCDNSSNKGIYFYNTNTSQINMAYISSEGAANSKWEKFR